MSYTIQQFNQQYPNDDVCLDEIFQNRHGHVTTCPDCGVVNTKFYRIKARKCYSCMHCGYQINPLAGTIFHKTDTPLTKWFFAIYLIGNSKNSVSAKELERHLGVTYKTAWRMAKQIRLLMSQNSEKLSGIVEADETYYGGKHKRSEGRSRKTPVMGLVERKGRVKTHVVAKGSAPYLLPRIITDIDPKATVMTDQLKAYHALTAMGYPHYSVNHSVEYVVGTTHTNTIEGFWSHFKNGIKAIYIHVSPKHLQKYADEYGYRYNTRELTDGERFEHWFGAVSGKRLTYKSLIAK